MIMIKVKSVCVDRYMILLGLANLTYARTRKQLLAEQPQKR